MTYHMGYTRATLIDPEPDEDIPVHLVRYGEKRTLCGVSILILMVSGITMEPIQFAEHHDNDHLCRICRNIQQAEEDGVGQHLDNEMVPDRCPHCGSVAITGSTCMSCGWEA